MVKLIIDFILMGNDNGWFNSLICLLNNNNKQKNLTWETGLIKILKIIQIEDDW